MLCSECRRGDTFDIGKPAGFQEGEHGRGDGIVAVIRPESCKHICLRRGSRCFDGMIEGGVYDCRVSSLNSLELTFEGLTSSGYAAVVGPATAPPQHPTKQQIAFLPTPILYNFDIPHAAAQESFTMKFIEVCFILNPWRFSYRAVSLLTPSTTTRSRWRNSSTSQPSRGRSCLSALVSANSHSRAIYYGDNMGS